ncbi:DUF1284 domain-containing protein [Brucella gallinifaecis]|uniref:DUF1284 domain-containing protein n=1 Tax=Brucella gallinifaecis TaxID=215590 RepID=A0A502BMJ3_9HYPH|nr:DUF1284 domain-containing protein [Brucella gallinifaecis]TPF74929.1 DUF1284 domain-containing protein [Brucella gallinifaecis]
MTVRLRGHHLLCMLTYIGKGYSPAFVENYETIAGRLSDGEDIALVDGPDDICQPLLCTKDCHCFNESVVMRDRLALNSVSDLFETKITTGSDFKLDVKRLALMRSAFAAGTIRKACKSCEWSDLCTRIAVSDNYANVKITL